MDFLSCDPRETLQEKRKCNGELCQLGVINTIDSSPSNTLILYLLFDLPKKNLFNIRILLHFPGLGVV